MSERLYYRDASLLEFDAQVVEHAGDAHHVVLDRTAFYPTSGGQPHDIGVLGASRVVDVIDEGARIVHVVEGNLPLGAVRGAVDGARRRDHMQQHTAQHLLSALAGDQYKWETASVHFGAEHSTIEFATSTTSDRQLADLQQWANAVVAQARTVSVTFEDAAAADVAGLRKPSGRSGEIRVIAIDGVDRSACGGTHVARTSEIGPVLLRGVEKIRGHTRVGFLAGGRVFSHVLAADKTLDALATELGCAVNQLEEIVATRQQESKSLRDQLGTLEQEAAGSRIRAMYGDAGSGADGLRRIMYHAADESASLLRLMAQAVAPLEQCLFVAIGATPPALYFATSNDSGVDAGALLKPALAVVGGRGGGSARVAQGTAPSAAALEQVAGTILGRTLASGQP